MNDKFLGWVLGTAIMAACCIGVPFLIVFLIGTGVFAWIADNGLAVIAVVVIVVAVALLRREQINRHHRTPET